MKRCLIIIMAAFSLSAAAQTHYAPMLQYVEEHNPALQAAAQQSAAQQAAVHAGALIADPDVDAAYYWGSPNEIGIRWDLSVSQSFEMPSVLVRRARLRRLQDSAATISYAVARNSLLYETQQVCADLIYYRSVANIWDSRTSTAAQLSRLYRQRLDAGDCSILDYNRVQMMLAEVQRAAAEAVLNASHTNTELNILTGGHAAEFMQTAYDTIVLPLNFADWYEQLEMRNPALRQLDNASGLSQQQLRLARSQWLPQASVGYASENVVGETFRGVTVGLTLPIWSQQRSVRAARLQADAAAQELAAQRTQLYAHLECLFHHLYALRLNLDNLRAAYGQCNSLDLLDKALQAGEITLEQYLQQSDYYVDIQLQICDLARQYEQAWLQFNAFTL